MLSVKQRSGDVEYDRGLAREARTDGVLKERLAGECTAGGKMCKRLVKRRDVYKMQTRVVERSVGVKRSLPGRPSAA